MTAAGDEETHRAGRARAVALFRYSLIREAADPALSTRQRGRVVRGLAAREHAGPFGAPVRVSRASLDRWIRAWRAGGFDALMPPARQVTLRTPAEVPGLAAALKRENPARTAAQVMRVLRASGGWSPSERTLQRHFVRLELITRPDGSPPPVFGRFEAGRPNEMWTGDALHGPVIGGRKTYLFAFTDDHSRLITGHRFGHAEDTVRLAAALRPALASHGVPERIYVDNGSAFVDAWLLRACAVLGATLTHSTPGRPQGRGKIERFFLTVREQFLVEITGVPGQGGRRHVADIGELNRLFTAWAETVYHRRVHSETGQAPSRRWADGWKGAPPPLPEPAQLHEAFLWSERRTVRKTATVSLHGNTYQARPVPGPAEGRAGLRPIRPDQHRGPLARQARRAGRPPHHRPPCPSQSPPRAARPARSRDRHRLHGAAGHRPRHPPGRRRHQLRRPHRPARPRATAGPAHHRPGHRRHRPGGAVSIEKLQAHYGFTRMPFRRDLAPGMLHRHAAHAEAAARISWCISEHAPGVITGEVGAGKTVALRAAFASLDASRHTLIYLGNPSVGVRGINHVIVAALGGVPKTHHATLTPQAMDLLAREHDERGRIPVLAIDEAHMLEPAQLEAIRMLTNPDLDSGSPLACLLIGQPTLRRRIKLGILAALDQRIAVRYTMPGMSTQETASYISHHLQLAGRSGPLFSDDATALIHTTSRGLPRAVNNLAIQALIAAYAGRKAIVDESAARTAAAEVTAD